MSADPLRTHLTEAVQIGVHMNPDYAEDEKGVVTKWIIIAEVMEPNGERSLWVHDSANLTTWDAQGMLHDVLTRET